MKIYRVSVTVVLLHKSARQEAASNNEIKYINMSYAENIHISTKNS